MLVDSGTENLNSDVDSLVAGKLIERTVAQIDIEFSNSMIEAVFHRLKHRHLFNVPLSSIDVIANEVDFYLSEANEKMPHSALKGATPLEAITGKWNEDRATELRKSVLKARQDRLEINRNLANCQVCLA